MGNDAVIAEFRANGGRVGGALANATIMLLHHIGARSGLARVTPVGCFPQPDGRYAVIASSGGSLRHPAWYHNVKADNRFTVEVANETFTVEAEEVQDEALRARLWAQAIAQRPEITTFQAMVRRRIPVLLLTRQS
jgi:deazaflavin-dependent oxidoreductase (nitroreductase family)